MTRYPEYDGSQNCARPGTDPEAFFPTQGNGTAKAAKAICNGVDGPPCPFLDPCLAWALTYSVSGIYGGTSEEERNRLRHARGITPKPVPMPPMRDRRHGTDGAVKHHQRLGQPLCDLCRVEYNLRKRKAQAARRARREAS